MTHHAPAPSSATPDSATNAETVTTADAERLTTRIQLRLGTIADNVESVLSLIEQAKDGNVHQVLGYPSWTVYVAERFGGTLTRIGKAERLPIVELLSGQGMSTRAIATVVGVNNATVHRDLERVAHATPEPAAPQSGPPVPKVVGIDGKSYSRPAPAAPRRRPLPDQARDAGWDLRKSADRIGRILADDRLSANREQVCHALRRHLRETQDTVRDALDLLPRDEAGVTDPYWTAIDDLDSAVQRFERVDRQALDEARWPEAEPVPRQHLKQLRTALQQVAVDLGEWWSSC